MMLIFTVKVTNADANDCFCFDVPTQCSKFTFDIHEVIDRTKKLEILCFIVNMSLGGVGGGRGVIVTK